MIKAIFILENLTKEKIDRVIKLGANTIFTASQNLTSVSLHYIKKGNLKLFVEFGIFQGEDLWQKYPDSIPVDRNEKKMEKINWYAGVCPNNAKIRTERLTLIKHLIKVKNIDGIWLDFIRYPGHWEEIRNSSIPEFCFCTNCLTKFEKEVGGKPEGEKWIDWKCKQITDFVLDVKKIIKKTKKNITLGMFAIPWQKNEFDNAIANIIGQDFALLPKYIDVFSPMTYQKFCDRPVSWISQTTKYFSKTTHKPILPIIQTDDRVGKIYMNEFRAEIVNAIMHPSQGLIIFFLEDLLKDKNKIKVVEEIF